MKRLGYLYEKICSLDNLILAENKARKGKTNKKDVIEFDLNKHKNLLNLQNILINQKFKTKIY